MLGRTNDTSTAEKQRKYIRDFQDLSVPCPLCCAHININVALDNDSTCPKCERTVTYCLGLTGRQWFK